MTRLLLIEDDPMMGQAIKLALAQAGYVVDLIDTAEDGEAALRATPYDLVVLDINLPGKSGLDMLKGLRREKSHLPVIALTARDTLRHKVEGLNAGADDYLVKPFDLEELLARLQALHRRSGGRPNSYVENGPILLDQAGKRVLYNGKTVSLSAKEFAILALFMENLGRILNRQDIEDKLYGWDVEIESNTIEVHISHLRKKIGETTIKTIRGLGYVVEKIT